MTWQPISEAPFDGARVVLGNPDWSQTFEGFYFENTNADIMETGWYSCFDLSLRTNARPVHPTHFQPLPSPPSKGEK